MPPNPYSSSLLPPLWCHSSWAARGRYSTPNCFTFIPTTIFYFIRLLALKVLRGWLAECLYSGPTFPHLPPNYSKCAVHEWILDLFLLSDFGTTPAIRIHKSQNNTSTEKSTGRKFWRPCIDKRLNGSKNAADFSIWDVWSRLKHSKKRREELVLLEDVFVSGSKTSA